MKMFAALAARNIHRRAGNAAGRKGRKAQRVCAVMSENGFHDDDVPAHLRPLSVWAYEATLPLRTPALYRPPVQWFTDAVDTGLGVDLELAAIIAATAAFRRCPPMSGFR
jgi:hypothetical protein